MATWQSLADILCAEGCENRAESCYDNLLCVGYIEAEPNFRPPVQVPCVLPPTSNLLDFLLAKELQPLLLTKRRILSRPFTTSLMSAMSAKMLARTAATTPKSPSLASRKSPTSISSPRPILKRPTPLSLSASTPFPFSPRFSLLISPANAAEAEKVEKVEGTGQQQNLEEKTPRVHFPPSPVLVTSTFAAHSSDVYDRGAISVSPNPLEIPSWGDRIYSPTIGGFRAKTPNDDPSLKPSTGGTGKKDVIPSPALLSPASPIVAASIFGDAETPEVPALEIPAKAKTKAGAKFRERIAAQIEKVHEPSAPMSAGSGLGKSLMKYPRSPYPSAPVSPALPSANEADGDGVLTPTGEGKTPQRSASVHGDSPVRVSRLSLKQDEKMRAPSPLQQSFVAATPQIGTTVVANQRESLASPGLRQAFWKSVSIEDEPVSADIPNIAFGGKDGALWSPTLAEAKSEGVLMKDRRRSKAMSPPPPDDPFAAFPSFAAVLSMGNGPAIAYPPRVLTTADLPEDVVED